MRWFAPGGDLIGKIHLPEICANFCFGGNKHTAVYRRQLYAVYVETGALLT